MCGRFAQYRVLWEYVAPLAIELPSPSQAAEPIGRYNVAPQSEVMIIRSVAERYSVEPVRWGYKPAWAQDKRPPVINARVETVATSKFFRPIWHGGRCIVPADGWYEWVKPNTEHDFKQPYYICRRDGSPLYFAGVGQFSGDTQDSSTSGGFVIITGDSDGNLADVHNRKPLVLAPEAARRWLDQSVDDDAAYEMLVTEHTGASEFEWFKVDRAVGNVRNQGPQLIQRLHIQ